MVKTFTAVEDDGATVKITVPAGSGSEKISVPKKYKVAVEGTYVRITDVNNDQYVALYSTVTTPVAGSADLLRIALEAFNETGSGALATEATLQSVLLAIQGEKDFEANYVRDTGFGNLVVLQIITYNEGTGTFNPPVYYTAAGVLYVPVGPLTYLDSITALASILTSLGATTDAAVATDANGSINAHIRGLIANQLNGLQIVKLPSGTETPSASTVTDSTGSPVTAGKVCVTFNTSTDFVGTILGIVREADKEYTFEIKNPGKTLAAIAYTVTAGSMIIDVQV